jgi:hypothetical protein
VFFHESSSSKPLQMTIGTFRIFFENSRWYLQVKLHHRNQRRRWQIMGKISDCWHLKWISKEKFIYMLTLLPKGVKKSVKTFLIEDFFHLPPVSTTPVMHLELLVPPLIFEKIRNGPNGILRGLGGNWFMKKPEVENIPLNYSRVLENKKNPSYEWKNWFQYTV